MNNQLTRAQKERDARRILDNELYTVKSSLEKLNLLMQEITDEYFCKYDRDDKEDHPYIVYGFSRTKVLADMVFDYVINAKGALDEIYTVDETELEEAPEDMLSESLSLGIAPKERELTEVEKSLEELEEYMNEHIELTEQARQFSEKYPQIGNALLLAPEDRPLSIILDTIEENENETIQRVLVDTEAFGGKRGKYKEYYRVTRLGYSMDYTEGAYCDYIGKTEEEKDEYVNKAKKWREQK